jgi:NAD(P)-dependent dehydrogenase (short-subunit alcohol dehydrogenase family)
MAPIPFAVVAGVGPGTGAAVARRFSKAYPIALLARSPESYEPLVKEINNAGGQAIGISADVSNEESIKSAFAQIKKEYQGAGCAAAIFNASGRFVRKPLLEMSVDDFSTSWEVSAKGALIFSQAALPLLVQTASSSEAKHPPTLIYTGATASVKANAQVAAFASGKWALRALSNSIAREFAPQGVHVAHAIIDGPIDIAGRDYLKDMPAEAKIAPGDIAETYWNLHTQSVRCFTNEVDIRAMLEKW